MKNIIKYNKLIEEIVDEFAKIIWFAIKNKYNK